MKVSELQPGMVLDENDPATREVLTWSIKRTMTSQGMRDGRFRTVREVQNLRTYTYITFESYAIVRRPKDYEVKVK